MINRKTILLIILITSVSLSQAEQAYDTCAIPESPAIPVGSVSEEQLLDAISTVKNYQVDLEKFRICIDSLKVTIDEKSMNEEMVEKNKIYNVKLDSIYNLSIDREQAVVDQLNTQIREYKKTNN